MVYLTRVISKKKRIVKVWKKKELFLRARTILLTEHIPAKKKNSLCREDRRLLYSL